MPCPARPALPVRFALFAALTLAPLRPARAAPDAAPADEAARTFVLMVNGGGTREENFASHVLHLRELSARLVQRGIPKERITILASDGADPAADFARRSEPVPGFWRLEGTPVERWLEEPLQFESSTVAGWPLQPATRASVTGYLRRMRVELRAGDTLVVYVTDHGQQDSRDHLRNQITLWGRREGVNVRQLGAELRRLQPGVRVVTLMSQCFSGGFARLPEVVATPGEGWQGPVCGYFASPADRPAYGCYPEAMGGERKGHAFTLIDALAASARLRDAHRELVLRDDTPDVPLRTSDVFLADVLARAGAARGVSAEALADEWLGKDARGEEAGGAEAAADLATARTLARRFGFPSTVLALGRQLDEVAGLRDEVGKHQDLWHDTLADRNRGELAGFLRAQPAWDARLRPAALRRLDDDGRRALSRELIAALRAFTNTDARARDLADELEARAEKAAALTYRLEVREAVGLRVRALLMSAAARRLLARPDDAKAAPNGGGHSDADARWLAGLDACEDLTLPRAPNAARSVAAHDPVPALADERAAAVEVHPAWLGIAFRAVVPARRRQPLPPGAAVVTAVVPGSPAAAAGLSIGDTVVGAGGQPLAYENAIRALTMLARVDAPFALEVWRGGKKHELTAKPRKFPSGK